MAHVLLPQVQTTKPPSQMQLKSPPLQNLKRPASVIIQLERASDSQSPMFRVFWFIRKKKKKFAFFVWSKKRK
jgi:hypothetical protein